MTWHILHLKNGRKGQKVLLKCIKILDVFLSKAAYTTQAYQPVSSIENCEVRFHLTIKCGSNIYPASLDDVKPSLVWPRRPSQQTNYKRKEGTRLLFSVASRQQGSMFVAAAVASLRTIAFFVEFCPNITFWIISSVTKHYFIFDHLKKKM